MRPRTRSALTALRRAVVASWHALRTDGMMLAGAAVLAWGASMVYEPLGVIVAGVSLIGLGWIQGAST